MPESFRTMIEKTFRITSGQLKAIVFYDPKQQIYWVVADNRQHRVLINTAIVHQKPPKVKIKIRRLNWGNLTNITTVKSEIKPGGNYGLPCGCVLVVNGCPQID
jgi:hypothetical protein